MFDMLLHVYPVVKCVYICCLKHVGLVYIGGVCKWLMFDVYSVGLA